MNGIDRGLSIE